MKGTVKFFDDRKNYGFIEPEDGSDDVFVHRNDIEPGPINEDDIVEFEIEEGEKGPKATNVVKVEE